jgi:hypothetical protein
MGCVPPLDNPPTTQAPLLPATKRLLPIRNYLLYSKIPRSRSFHARFLDTRLTTFKARFRNENRPAPMRRFF